MSTSQKYFMSSSILWNTPWHMILVNLPVRTKKGFMIEGQTISCQIWILVVGVHLCYAFVMVCSRLPKTLLYQWCFVLVESHKPPTRSVFCVVESWVDWLSPLAQLLPGCVNVQRELMGLLSFSRLGYLSKDRMYRFASLPPALGNTATAQLTQTQLGVN